MNFIEAEGTVTEMTEKSFKVGGIVVKKIQAEGLAKEIKEGMGVYIQGEMGFKGCFWVIPQRIVVKTTETFGPATEECEQKELDFL